MTTLFALISVWWASALLRPESRAVARFNVTPAQDQRMLPASAGVDIALSPDGSQLVYVGAAPGGGTQLWRRGLGDLDAVAIPGTEGAVAPDVSPDSESIAFNAAGAIKWVSLQGGPAVTIVSQGGAPTWGSDGFIYFTREGIVYRVSATGGDPEAVTVPVANSIQRYLDALPDGRGLLLTLTIGPPLRAASRRWGPRAVRSVRSSRARWLATRRPGTSFTRPPTER
jgi:hypothetical protein